MKTKLYKLDKVVFLSYYFTTDADFLHFAKDLIHTLANKRSVESCEIISVQHLLEKSKKIPGYLVDSKEKFVNINDIQLVNNKYE